MAYIKRDDNKQKWENSADTEFPLVCETCLGDNPYIRMTKEPHGKKCQICEIPFTVFAWQAGTKGRWKKVEICQNCAKTKNVCQVCIFDLQYGLPVKLRDKIIRESGGGGSSNAVVVPPQSDANLSWFTQSQARAIENGTHAAAHSNIPTEAAIKLQKMARMEPRYERNLAKLCSFFARGECNRGNNCPFRHEMPKDRNDPLSKQNTKDRFYGTNDPVAEKMIHRSKELAAKRKAEALARGEEEADGSGTTIMGTTLYCRFGDDADISSITEQTIRDKFYSFGEISSVRFTKDHSSVFVEYTSRSATELAILSMDKHVIGGKSVYVSWARAPKRGNPLSNLGGSSTSTSSSSSTLNYKGPIRPLAAPGASENKPKLRPGFAPVRPSAEVLAAAAAKRNAAGNNAPIPAGGTIRGVVPTPLSTTTSTTSTRPSALGLGVPRPGGGVIRRAGSGLSRVPAPKPYYPSQNPGRLGSHVEK